MTYLMPPFVVTYGDEGRSCPTCDQWVKVYEHRQISTGQVRSMLGMFRIGGPERDWIHLPTQLSARSREEGKLQWWGLVERSLYRRGYWRLTTKGVDWLFGDTSVQRYARVYNNQLLELHGGPWTVHDAYGARFNLEALLGGSRDA